ncbi:Transcription initiation factor TFIID subunit [Spraguea lophii 42_110]|uniref:Transcription initiation factor TFIID subunit 11 n=1 Tax=Spraguea lophii (strain 42_110) TaxID=1358809 RepID=S7W8C8_SPRLO|nr:Transcription initiation factor TFIID subunit [Spraguea lophii 42_110]
MQYSYCYFNYYIITILLFCYFIPMDKTEDTKQKGKEKEVFSDSSIDSTSSDIAEINKDERQQIIQKLVTNMSTEEEARYESFRRSGFGKNITRKIVSEILNQACNPNFLISVSGISKIFVGEMVDEALKIQKQWDDKGPLLPSHIHEAYRRIYYRNPNMKNNKFDRPW